MDEDDNSWVFDSLVTFLNGPIWSAPLESFIEEKSLIFEPNVKDSDEYKTIFDEFKNLVDFMLGNFMEDIGITPEQFEEACNKGHTYSIHFDQDGSWTTFSNVDCLYKFREQSYYLMHTKTLFVEQPRPDPGKLLRTLIATQNLFEQIWAANDYEMFKRMMTQKNVELQLQALELIEQKYGITPESFKPQKKNENVEVTIEKSSVMEKAIMKEVAKNFPKDEPSTSQVEIQSILEEKPILQQTLKKTKEKSVSFDSDNIVVIPPLIIKDSPRDTHDEKLSEENLREPEKPTNAEISFDKRPSNAEIDAKELKKRQDYLRAQRDKLVAIKKEARKKQLDAESGKKGKSKVRPKSAKAAEAVMSGDSKIEPQQLQIRKALAERLKTEVVSNKKV